MKDLEERKKLSYGNLFYSMQRIDLLIISICGAGIYVILETLKYLVNNKFEINILLKVSAIFFIIGIIVNFLSQWSGYKSNQFDYAWCEAKIKAGKNPSKSEQLIIDKYDSKSDCYSIWTDRFNVFSIGSMFLGLIFIMSFFLFTF